MKSSVIDKLVKLEGTIYDRRRKLSETQVANIKSAYDKGVGISALAKKYKVSYNTIHYHVDEEYKAFHNQRRLLSTKSCNTRESRISRIAYKMSLLKNYVR